MISKEIENTALGYLARREHARLELYKKLKLKYKSYPDEIEQILDALTQQGLQSDARYCECFVRHRANQGYGLSRIKAELGQHNIGDQLIDETLANLGINWQEILHSRLKKRFGDGPYNQKDKAKALRYFSSRGFAFGDINAEVKTTQN